MKSNEGLILELPTTYLGRIILTLSNILSFYDLLEIRTTALPEIDETGLPEIQTAVPVIETTLPDIETALLDIDVALAEIQTALPETKLVTNI